MTGGSATIKLLTTSNALVNFTTTAVTLKAGTFKKIKRALELKKTLYFTNYTINGRECFYQPLEITAIGSDANNIEYIRFTVKIPRLGSPISGTGNPQEFSIVIEADEAAVVVQ